MRLTREETIKALRCCASDFLGTKDSCEDCPFRRKLGKGCVQELIDEAYEHLSADSPVDLLEESR